MHLFQTSDGTRLYFEDWGRGKPIVFVHGWPLSGAMWEYQTIPLTEAGFRCITYDRRGFGRSDKPYGGYDYATMGRDLAELIEHLDLNDVTLVGFSMGGGEVVEVLTRHNRGRVTRAMLVASVVPFLLKTADNPDGVDAEQFEKRKVELRTDRPAFLTRFFETFFGVGILTTPVSLPMLASCCEAAMTASPKATLDCITAFSSTDFRAACKQIDVPVMVIHGDQDANVPLDAGGRCAAAIIPGAQLKVYGGAPHGLNVTNARQLTRDIEDFVRGGATVPGGAERITAPTA